MRIPIREQLGLLVLFCSLMALMVLALATWFQNKNFIVGIRLTGLSLTASLKSAQLASTLTLYGASVQAITTRVLIQSSLQRYRMGNDTNENWSRTITDLTSAMGSGNPLLQARIYPPVDNGNRSDLAGLCNVTSQSINAPIALPYQNSNGGVVYLGDTGFGFPPLLYPNLTYSLGNTTYGEDSTAVSADGRTLAPDGILFLGPVFVNETYSLLSLTTGIINNTSDADVLGWLTVVVEASLLYNVQESKEGLGNSGQVLLVGPTRNDNRFLPDNGRTFTASEIEGQDVRFILPPESNSTTQYRHQSRSSTVNASVPFLVSSYPAIEDAWTKDTGSPNNAGAIISTHNEEGIRVSVGYATLASPSIDWVLIVEQSYNETVAPIDHLRDVVLICVFATAGFLVLIMLPLAHYSVAPIRALRAATRKTVEPYAPDDQSRYSSSSTNVAVPSDMEDEMAQEQARKEGFMGALTKWTSRAREPEHQQTLRHRRKIFRIPGKVPEHRHFITDELTDLTSTFNEMSDELTLHYERLEERVKERTAELETSKLAAEAANQSKTLFIANISHELKTPLNGILGLTTVCMNEDDISKIRSTLNTIYKSGDLLLHLLTDLLTFSKNEVGQQLSIDEAEFRLNDLSTQLIPTFERQAREGRIDLKVLYYGTNDALGNSETEGEMSYGPVGTGRVKDMSLWGDKNRILQVLMNFVSNSLKFTPPNGSVTVRVRCMGLMENEMQLRSRPGSTRKSSLNSKKSKRSGNKKVFRTSDTSLTMQHSSDDERKDRKVNVRPASSLDPKLSINVGGSMTQITRVVERRRSMSPPPLNTKDLLFEFEVEDTGPGIPQDQQKKIFEPFVQGDLGLSKKYGGTGLGLSICAQLASLMGGTISLESEVGVGSKFAMALPLRYLSERSGSVASSLFQPLSKPNSLIGHRLSAEESVPRTNSTAPLIEGAHLDTQLADIPRIVGFTQPYVAKEATGTHADDKLNMMRQAETEAAKAGRKVRVLVAEDNKINQEVVLRMLKLEDVYDVTIAKDGQEAFEKVRDSMDTTDRFHLIFMDVQMPNVDGIQSTKMIRGMGFSAPIVALTAFAEKSNEDECMASGMDYFLAKPIRRPALKHVLKKYCTTIVEEDHERISPGTPKVVRKTPNGISCKESDNELLSSPADPHIEPVKNPQADTIGQKDMPPISHKVDSDHLEGLSTGPLKSIS